MREHDNWLEAKELETFGVCNAVATQILVVCRDLLRAPMIRIEKNRIEFVTGLTHLGIAYISGQLYPTTLYRTKERKALPNLIFPNWLPDQPPSRRWYVLPVT